MNKGYIHIYTGNGKGKTTSILGLTLRAVGAGKKVCICQFLKDDDYSEIKALKKYLPMVYLEQFGAKKGFVNRKNPQQHDIDAAQNGLARAREIISSNKYDIVIFDEMNVAASFKLISERDVLDIMDLKPEATELIITGRYASDAIMERADLVTEMMERKHYFTDKVVAREGIEK